MLCNDGWTHAAEPQLCFVWPRRCRPARLSGRGVCARCVACSRQVRASLCPLMPPAPPCRGSAPDGPAAARGARYYGLKPDIKVISPWREWDLNSRSKLISYAETHGIAVPSHKRGEPPFSMDANLLHISYEGCARVGLSPALLERLRCARGWRQAFR